MIARSVDKRTAVAIAMWLVAAPAIAIINTGIDAEAGLPYWEIIDGGVSIRLVQRLPDQTRGFFQARGFSSADAELIAQSCMFQTVFKNVAPASDARAVEYNLDEWVIHAVGKKRKMKTREDWKKVWAARGTAKAARLAFEWGLLPTRQRYRAGDYNWGLSVFNLAPGTQFDLDVVWRQGGQRRSARVNGVICAPDIPVSPGAQ